VEDFASYLSRFYANNVRDHRRQGAIDLLIGTTTTTANASANAHVNGSASVGDGEVLVGVATAVNAVKCGGDEEVNDSIIAVSDRLQPPPPLLSRLQPPPPLLSSIVSRAASKGKQIASIAHAKKASSRRQQGPLDRRRKLMPVVGAEKGLLVCDEMPCDEMVNKGRGANRSKEAAQGEVNVPVPVVECAIQVQKNDPPSLDGVGDMVGDVLLSQRACIDDALHAIRAEFLEHD
jgi:hypothetical protein